MRTFKLNVTSSKKDLTDVEFVEEVLLAETRANGTSLLRFHVEEIKPNFKLVSQDRPLFDIEVIGYNKEWIDEDFNPDGTCMSILLDDDSTWIVVKWCSVHNEYQHAETIASSFPTCKKTTAPTHWAEKPKFY